MLDDMDEKTNLASAITLTLIDSAQKIIGILAGVGSIAYIIGWQYSKTYWQSFHAAWVEDLLSSSQMLADASHLILSMFFAMLTSFLGVLWNVTDKTLSRVFDLLVALGVVASFVPLFPDSLFGIVVRIFYSLAPTILMWGVGVGVALLARWLIRANMKWNDLLGNHVIWLFTMALTTTPSMAASARSDEDRNAATSQLDVISWPERPDGDWRLGRAVDKGFISIKLTGDPAVTEVRLIPYGPDVLIRPVNQAIM